MSETCQPKCGLVVNTGGSRGKGRQIESFGLPLISAQYLSVLGLCGFFLPDCWSGSGGQPTKLNQPSEQTKQTRNSSLFYTLMPRTYSSAARQFWQSLSQETPPTNSQAPPSTPTANHLSSTQTQPQSTPQPTQTSAQSTPDNTPLARSRARRVQYNHVRIGEQSPIAPPTTPPPNPTRVAQRRTPYTCVNIIGGTTQNPTMPHQWRHQRIHYNTIAPNDEFTSVYDCLCAKFTTDSDWIHSFGVKRRIIDNIISFVEFHVMRWKLKIPFQDCVLLYLK